MEDLLGFDYRSIPDETFERKETIVNQSGRLKVSYVKTMDVKLCNLFSRVEVRFGANQEDMIVSLFSEDAESFELDDIERFVNDCYNIYGQDSSHTPKGIFNKADKVAVKKKSWAGRLWIHAACKPRAILSMTAEGLELTILAA
jgi:hypothetical protein